ncbi:hypothetical protein TM5383_01357 [Thalassovita mediterranea]|uniref:Transposase n=1 Tax=Thalassovita mediterranea TaxID=340021 RepID=A0A0P1HB23_9RHOB|nr:hypothetical protein TM5383_01357 [Thalassovita mediterranea]SIS27640.1 hypothetical protein SAMN05421685_101155 [Thalassovita mediterranea]
MSKRKQHAPEFKTKVALKADPPPTEVIRAYS